MRVFFMGTPDFAATCLAALYNTEYEVCGVFSQPDKPRGRGMKLSPSPVKQLALEHGTPVYTPTKLKDGTALETIRACRPDVIAVVAYGRLLPTSILELPRMGCINMHGSVLPKYRGSAPVQWAVINGEKETGITAMYMAPQMDAGDMISCVKTDIGENETFGELYSRLSHIAARLLCDTLDAIKDGTVTAQKQDESLVTFAPPITKELCEIDWSWESRRIANLIRGLNPAPAAVCQLGGQSFKLFSARALEGDGGKLPGEVISADKRGITVACGTGALLIEELQAPGGKRMRAADYLRGHPLCK